GPLRARRRKPPSRRRRPARSGPKASASALCRDAREGACLGSFMTARSSPRPESLGAAGRIRASFHAGAPALALKGAVFAGRKLDDFDAPAVVVAGQDQTG